MTLKNFLSETSRHWKVFAAVSATVFAVATGAILLTPATYVSTTELLVTVSGSTTAAAYQNEQVVTNRINSYLALLTTDVVSQRVVDKLQLPMTATELATKVSATNVPPRTSLIDVAVTDTSPERAQLLANTVANEFIGYTDALETPTGEDRQKIHTTVVNAATPPRARWAERVVLVVLSFITAVLLGSVAVWVRSRKDPLVRTAAEAEAAAGVPVIATAATTSELAPDDLAEYERLAAHLRSTIPADEESDERGRVWVLTSAVGEVDVRRVALHLGRALEAAGGSTVVLDCGAIQPLHDGEPVPTRDTDDDERDDEGDGDDEGPEADDGDETGDETDVSLDQLRDDYAEVIVVAPPVLSSDDGSVGDADVAAVALVVALDTSRIADVEQSAKSLGASDSPLTVAVCATNSHGAEIDSRGPWRLKRVVPWASPRAWRSRETSDIGDGV